MDKVLVRVKAEDQLCGCPACKALAALIASDVPTDFWAWSYYHRLFTS